MRSLITTCRATTSGDEVVFLGEWCNKYKERSVWGDKTYTTIPYHWKDREKFGSDYDYLFQFYEELLAWLCEKLNEIHGVQHEDIYWRTVIGPWLLVYVPVLFDRWENINAACALEEHFLTTIPNERKAREIAFDYNDSLELMGYDDDWNYLLYCDILVFKNNKYFKLTKEKFTPTQRVKKRGSWVKIRHLAVLLARTVDAILNKLWFSRSYKFVLYKSNMPLKFLVKIAFRQRQLPRIFSEFEAPVNYSNDVWLGLRRQQHRRSDVEFENFVYQQVFQDIPSSYLENYRSIQLALKRGNFPVNPEVIMTASAHYYNEVFKIWVAENLKKGSKLVVSAHGGALRAKYEVFFHEEKICDHKITWCKPYHDKHIQLSPTKLVQKNNYAGNGTNITLIGCEFSRYNYRVQSAPMSSLILEDFDQKVEFVKLLRSFELAELSLKIRPYPDRGWSLKDRYIDLFGSQIISTRKTLQDDFSNSKLNICTYPETTFFESMHSGIPTVLLFVEKYWELEETFTPIIRQLVSSRIAHTTAESAAVHIKNIYSDPQKWWNQPETKEARLRFDEVCGTPAEDVSLDKELHEFLVCVSNEN